MTVEEIIEKIWVERISKLEWQIKEKDIVIDVLKRKNWNLEASLSENQKYNKSKIKNESAREKAELRRKIKNLEEDLAREKEYSRKLYRACEELYERMWYKHCVGQLILTKID